MTYTTSFSLSDPTGLEPANTLDEIIRNVKIALNERFVDILGVDLSGATDPQRVTKIVIPAAGMNVRNSADSSSMIAVTNAGVTIASPALSNTTLSGTTTFSGSAVTLPSGSAITNASLTTPALVNPVIAGGAASDLTGLTVTGTPVITGNLTVTGNITAASISGTTSVAAANVTAGTFQNAAYTFPNNLNVSGTLAPTTLTIPSGTTIPTHTETGTITATGSTRNGGTLSGATLNNTTFTGTVTGLSTNPAVVNAALGSQVVVGTSATTVLSTSTITTSGSHLIIATGYVSASANGQALERVSLTLTWGGNGATSAFCGVLGSTSSNPTGYYAPFTMMFVATNSAGNAVTLTAVKYGSLNTCTIDVANISVMRIN